MTHSILFIQWNRSSKSKTYLDYESINDCLEGVCKLYEDKLFKKLDPNTYSVTYDIPLLFKFIDNLTDISCLVYNKRTMTYVPYNREWIKEKVYVMLRCQATNIIEIRSY